VAYRDSASFGKRQEYSAVAELLKRNFDVYMTLVDDQGIDCIVRLDAQRYVDIQIKARSRTAKNWNLFAAMTFEPRENLYFIFYTEANETYWTIPSEELAVLCSQNKTGKNKGKRHMSVPASAETNQSKRTDKAKRFDRYKNESGFGILRSFGISFSNQKAHA
jgi:hypothetical protein